MKPGELARLEAVVSRLELEGGGGRGNNSNAIQVTRFTHSKVYCKKNSNHITKVGAEEELLKRLALATSRIERSVDLAR